MGLSKELRLLRLRSGIDHERLAEALEEKCGLKISAESLKRYERSDDACAKMRAETLDALAKYYNVSVDYLLGRGGYEDPKISRYSVGELGLSEELVLAILGADSPVQYLNLLFQHESFRSLLVALWKYYHACEADSIVNAAKERLARECRITKPSGKQISNEIGKLKHWNKFSGQTSCNLFTLSDRFEKADETGIFTSDDEDNLFLNRLQMQDLYELQTTKYLEQLTKDLKGRAHCDSYFLFMDDEELSED